MTTGILSVALTTALALGTAAYGDNTRLRDYFAGVPTDFAFEFDTISGQVNIDLHFVPVQSVEHMPSVNNFVDPITNRAQVEFFDHLPLKTESKLKIGDQTYPLSCVRIRGGGMDEDSTPLQYMKLFIPTDDPDGQCIGPLNPEYPGEGEKRFRWFRYLVVSWDLENHRFIGAELFVAGVDYDLKIRSQGN